MTQEEQAIKIKILETQLGEKDHIITLLMDQIEERQHQIKQLMELTKNIKNFAKLGMDFSKKEMLKVRNSL